MLHFSCRVSVVIVLVLAPAKTTLLAQRSPSPVGLMAARSTSPVTLSATTRPSLGRYPASGVAMRRDVSTLGEERIEKAAIGAGIGFLGGTVLGSEIAKRCRPATDPRCSRTGRRVAYTLGFGLLGAIVGGAAGAMIAER